MPHGCRISSCRELVCGDEIQAQVGSVVHFRGRVTNLHPPMDLFWAVDAIGERRLIDFHEYAVYVVAETADALRAP
ncbi:hypothetical protein [Sinomonas sp. ASV322]|uniref:hypothetical protein n=1 Tax=Sinomonas sp. ASV322 TaxID=3041920 RepID=UPI0027DDBAC7|nr:hypothetical protein [Sinomonas sp. ASV322]MDQ4501056.1 hypothetical protein [Sinomonas sp. ASV322]